jgi:hypothetical protein
MNGD